ncbi:hypothetical protein [Microbacterium sp.]|uniref:variant leucine-rich repeat-containing protein n=1 Tax=Microbacterium sp. TaxID=51671 RepID=UPI0033428A26
MSGVWDDEERRVAGDPRTPPQQLADIAARRADLHPLIAANPAAYPALREWIARAGGAGAQGPQAYPVTPLPPPRRRGVGWWFAGCGCLAVVGVFVALAVVGGALLSPGDVDAHGTDPTSGSSSDTLAAFAAERQKYYALAAELDGNPVASLVTEVRGFQILEQRAESPRLTEAIAADLAQEARERRERLQQRIDEAETRRGNASGSITEGLVDAAGRGFIDIRWDADTACAVSDRPGRTTTGCVSEDPVAVHVLPESQLFGDWGARMVVLHELTHLYQRADSDAHAIQESSEAMKLVEKGLFQGSSEKMADCYALTYLNGWTLSNELGTVGYGYVCNAEERQAIRRWAAEIHAPMPG